MSLGGWVMEEEKNTIICGHVDEPKGHYVKQNKLGTERQNSYGHTQWGNRTELIHRKKKKKKQDCGYQDKQSKRKRLMARKRN